MQLLGLLPFISMLILFSLGNWRLSNAAHPSISKYINVDPSGGGDFKTIHEAIEQSVPENNAQWIHIHVVAGIYTEQVTIPPNKPFIILEGDGRGKTIIQWNANTNIFDATLNVKAKNFVAKQITVKNTFNREIQTDANVRKPAVAVVIGGDMNSFYDCGFIGLQDTLHDFSGRHYFHQCYIEGSCDFIFGNGQSIYESCKINATTALLLAGIPGYITAQKREHPDEPTGFVFKSCFIVGGGPTYLGRAYGPYSRVLYYKSFFSDIVAPEGWDAWHYKGNENRLVYVEVDNKGPGSNTLKRVPWEKKLSDSEVQMLVGESFINSDGWIQKQQ